MFKFLFIFIIQLFQFNSFVFGSQFPNYFKEIPKQQSIQLLNSLFASILGRLDVMYYDSESKTLKEVGFFQKLDAVLQEQNPGSKAYISGGVVRSLLGYIYQEMHYMKEENPNLTTDQILRILIESKERIQTVEALGVGSDLDILVDLQDGNRSLGTFEALKKQINSAQEHLGLKEMQDLIKNTIVPEADVQDRRVQTIETAGQGGSSLDWLVFLISGEKQYFVEPSSIPGIRPDIPPSVLGDFVDGLYQYLPPQKQSGSTSKDKQTIRGLRPLTEIPFLDVNKKLLMQELEQIISNGKISKAAIKQFRKLVVNSRFGGGGNYFYPQKEDLQGEQWNFLQLVRQVSILATPDLDKGVPVIPKFLPFRIPTKKDPCGLQQKNLLMSKEEFFDKHTHGRVLYHGTPNLDNFLSLFRNGFYVSQGREKAQGTATFGSGAYMTRDFIEARKYGIVLPVQINQKFQDVIKIVDIKNSPNKSALDEIINQSKKEDTDLNNYLRDKCGVDLVLNEHVILQNSRAVKLQKDLRQIIKFACWDVSELGIQQQDLSEDNQRILLSKIEQCADLVQVGSRLGFSEFISEKKFYNEIDNKIRILLSNLNMLYFNNKIISLLDQKTLDLILNNSKLTDESRLSLYQFMTQAVLNSREKKEIIGIFLKKLVGSELLQLQGETYFQQFISKNYFKNVTKYISDYIQFFRLIKKGSELKIDGLISMEELSSQLDQKILDLILGYPKFTNQDKVSFYRFMAQVVLNSPQPKEVIDVFLKKLVGSELLQLQGETYFQFISKNYSKNITREFIDDYIQLFQLIKKGSELKIDGLISVQEFFSQLDGKILASILRDSNLANQDKVSFYRFMTDVVLFSRRQEKKIVDIFLKKLVGSELLQLQEETYFQFISKNYFKNKPDDITQQVCDYTQLLYLVEKGKELGIDGLISVEELYSQLDEKTLDLILGNSKLTDEGRASLYRFMVRTGLSFTQGKKEIIGIFLKKLVGSELLEEGTYFQSILKNYFKNKSNNDDKEAQWFDRCTELLELVEKGKELGINGFISVQELSSQFLFPLLRDETISLNTKEQLSWKMYAFAIYKVISDKTSDSLLKELTGAIPKELSESLLKKVSYLADQFDFLLKVGKERFLSRMSLVKVDETKLLDLLNSEKFLEKFIDALSSEKVIFQHDKPLRLYQIAGQILERYYTLNEKLEVFSGLKDRILDFEKTKANLLDLGVGYAALKPKAKNVIIYSRAITLFYQQIMQFKQSKQLEKIFSFYNKPFSEKELSIIVNSPCGVVQNIIHKYYENKSFLGLFDQDRSAVLNTFSTCLNLQQLSQEFGFFKSEYKGLKQLVEDFQPVLSHFGKTHFDEPVIFKALEGKTAFGIYYDILLNAFPSKFIEHYLDNVGPDNLKSFQDLVDEVFYNSDIGLRERFYQSLIGAIQRNPENILLQQARDQHLW